MSDERTTEKPGVQDDDKRAKSEDVQDETEDLIDEAIDETVEEPPAEDAPAQAAELDEDAEQDADAQALDADVEDASGQAAVDAEGAEDAVEAEAEPEAAPSTDGADASDAADEPDTADEDTEDDSYYGTMPRFLTREEYENFGDDPEPLPEGFEVIEGGAGNTGSIPPVAVAAEQKSAPAPEPQGPSTGEQLARRASEAGHAASVAAKEAASTVNRFITQGVGAVREMSAAKRAHAEAREQLEELNHRIADQTAELEHRRDVVERYPQIIEEQTTRKSSAAASIKAAESLQKTIQSNIDMLKKQLEDMRAADEATEKRLKAALKAAEDREESARESAERLKRRLSDAQRAVEKAQEAKAANIEAAQHAEIADATEELRRAKDNLPRITQDAEATLAAADAALAEAQKPVADARESFRGIADETGNARDALDAARKEAASRQKELKGKISEQERDLKDQQRAQQEAQAEIADADDVITKAAQIHDNPDVTERIAASLAADTAEHDELLGQVQALAETEASVRERTRGSRVKFIGAIAAVIAVVVVIAIIWFSLT